MALGDLIIALTGVSSATASAVLTNSLVNGLVGQAVTNSSGSFLVVLNKELDGIELTILEGSLLAENNDVTRILSGILSNTQLGSLSTSRELGLIGSDLVLSEDVIFTSLGRLLPGQTATIAQGSAAITIERTLDGDALLSGIGSVVFQDTEVSVTLSGIELQTNLGVLLIDGLREVQLIPVYFEGTKYQVLQLTNSQTVYPTIY